MSTIIQLPHQKQTAANPVRIFQDSELTEASKPRVIRKLRPNELETLIANQGFALPEKLLTLVLSSSIHQSPDNVELAISRLASFSRLNEDWDSYGAPAIDKSVITTSTSYLRSLRLDSNVEIFPAPSASGGVDIYFDHDNKTVLFAFNPKGQQSTFAHVQKEADRSVVIKEGLLDLNTTDKHFKWLIA